MTRAATFMLGKIRGVRVVDIAGGVCLVLVVLVVYWSKAIASAESSRILENARQIAAEEQELRVLKAERAYLAQPARLRRLSDRYLHLAPVDPAREQTGAAPLTIKVSTPAATAPVPEDAAR
jgi:hypothetical protein